MSRLAKAIYRHPDLSSVVLTTTIMTAIILVLRLPLAMIPACVLASVVSVIITPCIQRIEQQ